MPKTVLPSIRIAMALAAGLSVGCVAGANAPVAGSVLSDIQHDRAVTPGTRSARKDAANAAAQFDPSKFGRLSTTTLPMENGQRIIMRVNKRPITWNDFLIQVRLAGSEVFALHPENADGIMAALAPAVEDPLIQVALYRQFADENSLHVQPREVDNKIKAALSEKKPSVKKALSQLTPAQIRQFVTDNLIREKVNKLIGDRATSAPPTMQEITSFTLLTKPTTSPIQITRARHIVFRATPDMSQFNINDAEAKAKDVLEKIRSGLDFATAARQYSQDRFTAYLGGDIGYYKPGSMFDTFEKAASALKPGEISDIVRTPVGFHIIQVTDRRSDDLLLQLDAHRRLMAIENWKKQAGDTADVERYLKTQ